MKGAVDIIPPTWRPNPVSSGKENEKLSLGQKKKKEEEQEERKEEEEIVSFCEKLVPRI